LIGFLSPLSAASAARNVAAFRSGLRDLGYLEGHNATLALRFGDWAPERMAPPAQELVGLMPDARTIPIVIITNDDPVALGVAQRIAKPAGNITGTWFDYGSLVSEPLARTGALWRLTHA
jgi:putative ABC transport system substrate-binding protein